MSVPTLFPVLDNLAVNVLLGTTFTDEGTLEVLPDRLKVNVLDNSPVGTINQGDTPANAVLNAIDIEKEIKETLYEASSGAKPGLKQSHIVRVAIQIVLEPPSITAVMVTAKAQGLLQFDHDYELATKTCLAAKGIVQDLPNRPFRILVSNIILTLQNVDKNKVSARFNDDIDKIINTDQQICENILPPKGIISTVVNEKSSSTEIAVDRESKYWRNYIYIPDEYKSYGDEF